MLLTVDDVTRRGHYRNAYRTFGRLLELGVVPIVNENDTVATHEIRFGDNDRLAALVAHLVHADALILLSDVDALYTAHPRLPGGAADHRRPRRGRPGRGRRLDPRHGGRHRRHDHQDGRGPDRHLGRDPDGADLGRAGGRSRWPASRSAPSSIRPAGAARPGCCGSGTPATRAASWCWTPVRSARSSPQRLAAARRGDRRSAASSPPASPSTWSIPRARWWPADWSTTTPTSCPRCWARPPARSPRSCGSGYDRTVVHRDALVVMDPGAPGPTGVA